MHSECVAHLEQSFLSAAPGVVEAPSQRFVARRQYERNPGLDINPYYIFRSHTWYANRSQSFQESVLDFSYVQTSLGKTPSFLFHLTLNDEDLTLQASGLGLKRSHHLGQSAQSLKAAYLFL